MYSCVSLIKAFSLSLLTSTSYNQLTSWQLNTKLLPRDPINKPALHKHGKTIYILPGG